MERETDLKLYRRFLTGDEQALEELIGLYRHSLTAFINGFVQDMDTAESLMLDVFVDLVRQKGRFRAESSLKTYLFAIGRNKALRHLRRRRTDFVPLDNAAQLPADDQSPEQTVEDFCRWQAVRTAMQQLCPAYREILYLLYFEDMTPKEIGGVLHKSPKQIANLTYRAKQALKDILQKEGWDA